MKRFFILLFGVLLVAVQPVFADTVNHSDVTPPRIDSMTIQPTTIDTSGSDATILVTFTASDDLNSMSAIDAFTYITPSRAVQTNEMTLISTSVANGRVQSSWQFRLTFPKGTPAGQHRLDEIFVLDAAGNRCFLTTCNFATNNFFTITNNSPNSNIDITPFDIHAQMLALQTQIVAVNGDKATLQTQVNALLQDKITLQSNVNSLTQENANLQTQLTKLTQEKSIIQSQFDATSATSASTSRALSSALAQASKAKAQLARICISKPKPKGC